MKDKGVFPVKAKHLFKPIPNRISMVSSQGYSCRCLKRAGTHK